MIKEAKNFIVQREASHSLEWMRRNMKDSKCSKQECEGKVTKTKVEPLYTQYTCNKCKSDIQISRG